MCVGIPFFICSKIHWQGLVLFAISFLSKGHPLRIHQEETLTLTPVLWEDNSVSTLFGLWRHVIYREWSELLLTMSELLSSVCKSFHDLTGFQTLEAALRECFSLFSFAVPNFRPCGWLLENSSSCQSSWNSPFINDSSLSLDPSDSGDLLIRIWLWCWCPVRSDLAKKLKAEFVLAVSELL